KEFTQGVYRNPTLEIHHHHFPHPRLIFIWPSGSGFLVSCLNTLYRLTAQFAYFWNSAIFGIAHFTFTTTFSLDVFSVNSPFRPLKASHLFRNTLRFSGDIGIHRPSTGNPQLGEIRR